MFKTRPRLKVMKFIKLIKLWQCWCLSAVLKGWMETFMLYAFDHYSYREQVQYTCIPIIRLSFLVEKFTLCPF